MTTGKARKRIYSCSCGAGVEKYAKCGTVAAKGKEKADYAGLHGWRCQGACQGKIKVKVTLVPTA